MRTSSRVAGLSVVVAALLAWASCREAPVPPPPVPPAVLLPPLHDAVAGEELWMRRGREDWLWRVVSATDDALEVHYFRYLEGAPIGDPTRLVWPRNGFGVGEGMVIRRFERDRIEVAGRTWECWRIHAHHRNGIRYYWVSDELEVNGVLK